VVPAIWRFEVTNAFLSGERRGRLTRAQTDRALRLLETLPIEVETVNIAISAGPIRALARQEGLSVYDAAYLELAIRRGLSLATLDGRMSAVARNLGLPMTVP
jgi:predicted nucleic acid-binding protein